MTTILYPERQYADESVERRVYGPDVTILWRDVEFLSQLSDEDLAEIDGVLLYRQWARADEIARCPKLRVIVRTGVGYDRIDRQAAAQRNIIVCNVPDYGTTEVADHAIALTLALRRGLIMHHDGQRADPPAPWLAYQTPLLRRTGTQTFGVVGLGRIGTAAALRAKALGFKVVFFDPYLPNGAELGVGLGRAASLEELLRQSDVLSIHTPQTRETVGLIGAAELALLPKGAVVINVARGGIIDLEALTAALRDDHIAGAGLDVLPVEPPRDPVPALLRAYRAREPWLMGRLIVTPHAAFLSPESHLDIRVKSAETMRAALLTNRPQNVITPEMD